MAESDDSIEESLNKLCDAGEEFAEKIGELDYGYIGHQARFLAAMAKLYHKLNTNEDFTAVYRKAARGCHRSSSIERSCERRFRHIMTENGFLETLVDDIDPPAPSSTARSLNSALPPSSPPISPTCKKKREDVEEATVSTTTTKGS